MLVVCGRFGADGEASRYGSTVTASTTTKAWPPSMTAHTSAGSVPDALILKISTVAGHIEGDEPTIRVQYIDDATADFVAEGAPIPEADPDLAEALVHPGKVSQLIRLSREQFVQPGAITQLALSVQRAVSRTANLGCIAQQHRQPPPRLPQPDCSTPPASSTAERSRATWMASLTCKPYWQLTTARPLISFSPRQRGRVSGS